MKLAVLSDIHGNARALDAVREDIARRGIERIVHLGDSLYGPFDPRPVAEVLLTQDWPTVAGNEDRCLIEVGSGRPVPATARFIVGQLRPEHLHWLEQLPKTIEIDGFGFAFHGTPQDSATYLLTLPLESGATRAARADEIADQLRTVDRPLILCGHDHLPRVVRLPDGRTIVNPGSVGCPAFTDDAPIRHGVANGSPHARYAVVADEGNAYRADLIAIAYDWSAAADEASRNGFQDWSDWLRTGHAGKLAS